MRVVLDTNILIGALITRDTPPDRLYRAWLRGEVELVTSTAQLVEIAEVVARPRLQRFLDPDEAAAIIVNIGARALVLDAPPAVDLSPDPDDNRILAAAIAGRADLIVSGDKKHMLALGRAEGIPFVTARQALDRLGLQNDLGNSENAGLRCSPDFRLSGRTSGAVLPSAGVSSLAR